MADFSNLKRRDVTGDTLAEFVFDEIEGEPSIWLAPATDANKLYLSERLRISIERAEAIEREPRGKKRAAVSVEALEEDRELDRVIIAKCCAKKWGNPPVDATGQTPEFTEQNCYDFFKALPDWLFDPLRGFASNVYNFAPSKHITEERADAMGNSSPGG